MRILEAFLAGEVIPRRLRGYAALASKPRDKP